MAWLPAKYGCLYIDSTWKDILAAYKYTLSNLEKKKVQERVENLFGGSEQWLACISVRSAFDLFLSVMNFSKGSEIIFTAINIPDMTDIAEYHGLVVVPVDIEVETLAPKEELLELAVTDKTVAILAAHIYGKWITLDIVKKIAKTYGLYLLEDCAECFHGLKMKGDEKSDIVFFSFGPIKYNTSLGGAVVNVKNSKLLTRMRAKLESYPSQTHWTYFQKLIKYSLLMMGMNSPTVSWFGVNLFHILKVDYKNLFISFLRSFPENLIASLRYQPSAALLAFMYRRIRNAKEEEFELCKRKGDYVKEQLPDNVVIPGSAAKVGNYWLFPILVDDPVEVYKALEREGIEPYIGATQLRSVKRSVTPADFKHEKSFGSSQQDKSYLSIHGNTPPTLACEQYAHLARGVLSGVETGAGSAQEQCFVNIKPAPVESRRESPLMKCADSKLLSDDTPPNQVDCRMKNNSRCGSKANHSRTMNGVNGDVLFPHNATFIIDHVVYLPVHKRVPIWYLDYICSVVQKVMKKRMEIKLKNNPRIRLHSKL